MTSLPHVVEYPKREVRRSVHLGGFAFHPWGEFTPLTVSNISYSGCEIRTTRQMRRGDAFQLRVSGQGAAQVVVCWSGHQRLGCKFIPDAAAGAA
jgi:hypothetical protein